MGVHAVVAPSVAYGVTDFAEGFAGAVSVSAEVLTALRSIATRLRTDGWTYVCPGEQPSGAGARRGREGPP